MVSRGNKISQWWTCKKCLSRWERQPLTDLAPEASEPQDQDLVIFGKYIRTTNEELFRQDLAYCAWVMTTVDGGESSPALLRLAHYIHHKRLAQTYAADDFDLDM